MKWEIQEQSLLLSDETKTKASKQTNEQKVL